MDKSQKDDPLPSPIPSPSPTPSPAPSPSPTPSLYKASAVTDINGTIQIVNQAGRAVYIGPSTDIFAPTGAEYRFALAILSEVGSEVGECGAKGSGCSWTLSYFTRFQMKDPNGEWEAIRVTTNPNHLDDYAAWHGQGTPPQTQARTSQFHPRVLAW